MTDTAYTYALTATAVIQRSDATFIPADPGNLDYAAYLAWAAAGGVATPYVAPPAPPLSCDSWQIRAALTQLNLRTEVEAAVTASTSQSVKDAWGFQQVFLETDVMLVAVATALGQTPAQIHALFQLAVTLSP